MSKLVNKFLSKYFPTLTKNLMIKVIQKIPLIHLLLLKLKLLKLYPMVLLELPLII